MASDKGSYKLSLNGAKATLSFVYNLLNKDKSALKVVFSADLVRVLIALTHSLVENVAIFKQKTSEVYAQIKLFENYSSDIFASHVLSLIKSPVKFTFLAKVAFDTQNAKLKQDIATKFCSLIMNDKEKGGYLNFNYFLTFLELIDEATFREHVYPEIEFMMKRGLSLVSLIAQTINALNFKVNVELVKMLTSELFTDEYLVKEDYVNDVNQFFNALAQKIDSKEAANALLTEFLLK